MTSTRSPATEQAELVRALAVLCERPTPQTQRIAALLGLTAPTAVDHTELFVHQLPPYASIYLDPDGKIGGQARDLIAGFWKATGFTPPPEPDHLAALLGLWAALVDLAADTHNPARHRLLRHAQDALVYEHLAPWLSPYLIRVEDIAPDPYPAWARLLGDIVQSALTEYGGQQSPRHLADPPSPPQHPDDLIPYLLAPIRSGIILTRSDLNRAAHASRTGIRIGERAYALQHLLDQHPQAVLDALATEAEAQTQRLQTTGEPGGFIDHWVGRAEATCVILREMSSATAEQAT